MSITRYKNMDSDYFDLSEVFNKKRIRKSSHDYEYLLDLQMKLRELRANAGSFEEGVQLVKNHHAPVKKSNKYIFTSAESNPMLYIHRRSKLKSDGSIDWEMTMLWDGNTITRACNNLPFLKNLRDVLMKLRSSGGSYVQAKQILSENPNPSMGTRPTTPTKPKSMRRKTPKKDSPSEQESPPKETNQLLLEVHLQNNEDDNSVHEEATSIPVKSKKESAPPFIPDTAIITVGTAKEPDRICLNIRKARKHGGYSEPYPLKQGIYFLFHFGEKLVFIDHFDLLGDRIDTIPVRLRADAIPVRLVRYKNKPAWIQSNRPIPNHPYWQEIKHFYPDEKTI